MSACLLVAGKALTLATGLFTLSWTHSVEKTGWREQWRVEGSKLQLQQAAVKGSGAGMEPGENAKLVDGWWVWEAATPLVSSMILASSGTTGGGWTLCADGRCEDIGASQREPLVLRVCP